MRDNVEAESPEDYFRKSITVPFLDYALNEMKTMFTDLHARTAWDYSWFHLLLEILLHNLIPPPPPRQQSLWIRP